MKQGKLRPWFRMLGMTILGSAIFALGFDLFLLPNQINIGGVSGIGMLLLELTGWGSVGLYSILINVPLFILGGKRLGRQFFFGSLAGMLLSSLFIDLFAGIPKPGTEILLDSLYGGLFVGSGLLGGGVEQLCELSLRDEHDLRKLIVVQPDDLLHGGGHVLGFGHRRAVVRVGQGSICLFGGHALAPGLGALILRVAAYRVAHAVHLKFQFHKGGGLVVCVLAAQHGALPDAAAGMIVQRIGDGIKKGGLARAGVAGNEVQPAFAQFFKVKGGLGGIGA